MNLGIYNILWHRVHSWAVHHKQINSEQGKVHVVGITFCLVYTHHLLTKGCMKESSWKRDECTPKGGMPQSKKEKMKYCLQYIAGLFLAFGPN